jgi:hypothetical protein
MGYQMRPLAGTSGLNVDGDSSVRFMADACGWRCRRRWADVGFLVFSIFIAPSILTDVRMLREASGLMALSVEAMMDWVKTADRSAFSGIWRVR